MGAAAEAGGMQLQAGGHGPGVAVASGSCKGRKASVPWSFLETHFGLMTSRTAR